MIVDGRRVRTRRMRIGDRVIYRRKRPSKGEPRFWLGTIVPTILEAEQHLYPAPSNRIATNADRVALEKSGALNGREVSHPCIRWDHEPASAAIHFHLDRIRLVPSKGDRA